MGMISAEEAKASGLPIAEGMGSAGQPGAPGPSSFDVSEAANFDAAKAAFASAMGWKQPATEPAAAPAAPAAAAPAASTPAVPAATPATPEAAPAPAAAPDLSAVLSRLTTLESDREAARKERDALQAQLVEAQKNAALADLMRKDPVRAMKEAGMTLDQVQDLLINGASSEAVKKSEAQQAADQLAEVRAQLAAMQQEKAHAAQLAEHKSAVQKYRDEMIKPGLASAPLLSKAFGDGAVDHVFTAAKALFDRTGVEPDIKVVISGLERNLVELRSKLGMVDAPATVANTPAVAPSLSALQSASTTSARTSAGDDEAALEAAASLLKQLRSR